MGKVMRKLAEAIARKKSKPKKNIFDSMTPEQR